MNNRKDNVEYGYNNLYLTRDGNPYFPIMGEMHYARVDKKNWRSEMLKMKSCGVDIVSTYVFWIFHEQIEGQYDFSNNNDIREFIKIADEVGLKVWLRIGPFVHSELRNGGFPDWLISKCNRLRTNDNVYIEEIKKYLTRIYEEVKGLFHKDNGPIIGIQVENELGHVGGGDKKECEEHLKTLMQIIKEIGFVVPFYTATGWGGAITDECIPVMGGYCDAPWERSSEKLSPSTNYMITKERDDHMIGLGNEIGSMETYKYEEFPFLTAELGGGLCPTYRRRPVISGRDIGAVSLSKLASGCNLFGYYMFHGGINPKGINYPLNETIETGSWSDLPEFDYDFLAPLGSYGQIKDTYKELRLLFLFVKDFGEEICQMKSEIDTCNKDGKEYESVKSKPDNFTDIRYSIRHKDDSGFIFINNYVKGYDLGNHEEVNINNLLKESGNVKLQNLKIDFPTFAVKNKDYFFYPYNLKIGDMLIKSALATPLCTLKNSDDVIDEVIFYGNDVFDVERGKVTNYHVIDKKTALNVNKVKLDREYAFICDGIIVEDIDKIDIISTTDSEILVYPACESLCINGYEYKGIKESYALYVKTADCSENNSRVEVEIIGTNESTDCTGYFNSESVKTIDYNINLNYNFSMDVDNVYLKISYAGDMLKLYIDGNLVNDSFNLNEPFVIGLKDHGYPENITLKVYGLNEGNDKYFEKATDYVDGLALDIKKLETVISYKYKIYEK